MGEAVLFPNKGIMRSTHTQMKFSCSYKRKRAHNSVIFGMLFSEPIPLPSLRARIMPMLIINFTERTLSPHSHLTTITEAARDDGALSRVVDARSGDERDRNNLIKSN